MSNTELDDNKYDYWENLEHDFGFSEKEMRGIRRAAKQYADKQILEARLDELERLPRPDGTMSTTTYGLKVDFVIDKRLKELASKGDV